MAGKSRLASTILLFAGVMLAMAGCKDDTPLRIGFLGGLTGRVADLGTAGRNGVILAVEERNLSGGINGRRVELLVRDDEQNPETGKREFLSLAAEKVEAVIGPMTSSIAVAVAPLAEEKGILLISPTVTTKTLMGKDDNFIRTVSVTTDYAGKSARYQREALGKKTFSAIYDIGNRAYTEDWFEDFKAAFEADGGSFIAAQTYKSGNNVIFGEMVQKLLKDKPDLLLIVANAVDAAMICQQVRKMDPWIGLAVSEWASTERFTELGGAATDNVYVAQFLDRNDKSQDYQRFLNAYKTRFNQEPGFAGMAGFDAARVVLDGLAAAKTGSTLKSTILGIKTFKGAQQELKIDLYGEADRKVYVTVVKDGGYNTVR